MGFEGKVALVTGAASGIGEATAKLLAEKGAHVLVADVTEQAGERVVSEIEDAGDSAAFAYVDVSDETSAQRMVADAVDRWGGQR